MIGKWQICEGITNKQKRNVNVKRIIRARQVRNNIIQLRIQQDWNEERLLRKKIYCENEENITKELSKFIEKIMIIFWFNFSFFQLSWTKSAVKNFKLIKGKDKRYSFSRTLPWLFLTLQTEHQSGMQVEKTPEFSEFLPIFQVRLFPYRHLQEVFASVQTGQS